MGRLKDYLFEKAEEWAMEFPEEELFARIDEYLDTVLTIGKPPMKQPSKLALSKQQAQILKNYLGGYLSILEDDTKMYRESCAEYYKYADKETGEAGSYYFSRLNIARDELRRIRAEKSKLADIQRVLKQLSK